jgi:hypothetical protein
MKNELEKVVVQEWYEFERGWGQRKDGISVHKSMGDALKYVDIEWTQRQQLSVPNEYRKPNGSPYWTELPKEHTEYIGEYHGGVGPVTCIDLRNKGYIR